MKTIEEVKHDIDGLVEMLVEKGKIAPEVSIEIYGLTDNIRVWMRFRNSPLSERSMKYTSGDTPEEALDEARKLISKMPSLKDAQLHEFMSNLGKLIDVGRDCGIEVEFLNPLTETMNRLSENIITFQPHIEAAE